MVMSRKYKTERFIIYFLLRRVPDFPKRCFHSLDIQLSRLKQPVGILRWTPSEQLKYRSRKRRRHCEACWAELSRVVICDTQYNISNVSDFNNISNLGNINEQEGCNET